MTYANGERVIFVPTSLRTVASNAAPWASVIVEGIMGFWCATSSGILDDVLNDRAEAMA